MKRTRNYIAAWIVVLVGLMWGVLAVQVSGPRQVIPLDGTWEITFDPNNVGREAGWHKDAVFAITADRREIQVPSCWEQIEQDYEGVAFYRRTFDLPAKWSGRVVRLQFDAVNYRAEVWLNDEVVGYHEGGFTPFDFRVDNILKPGERNSLILRVVGPIVFADKVVDGIGPLETPQWRGGITGGIWQSVCLIATGEVYVQDVFAESRIADDTVFFRVELDHTGTESTVVDLEIDLRGGNDSGTVARVRDAWTLRPGRNQRTWKLQVPDVRYWSPDDPYLYQASLRILRNGEQSDHWEHRFGIRELTIRDRKFYLNGKPIYIKAAFFEGLYPVGVAYPDSVEMVRKEIRLAKEAGFNMIRPWRKPPPPMWLDLADEMGVLTVGSLAVECMTLPKSTPYLPSRVENELRQSILRDRNRACVVQWELFNELHRPILKQMMRPMALLARELDPTRLILDESGGWAHGANIYLPYENEPTKFNDIHTYPGPFVNQKLFDGFLSIGLSEQEKHEKGLQAKSPGRNVVPGLMSFVSEVGYGSLPDLVENNRRFREAGNPLVPAYRYHHKLYEDQLQALQESGFEEIYPDLQRFCLDQQNIHGEANKRMIEAIRSNPGVSGYCIHALIGGDWVLGAGLLDLWRNPKSHAYEATKSANQPRIMPIRVIPRNAYAERGAKLEIIGASDLVALEGVLKIEIVSRDGDVVLSEHVDTAFSEGVSQLYSRMLDTGRLQGPYEVKARFEGADGSVISENSRSFDVFQASQLAGPENKLSVLDPNDTLRPFLVSQGIPFEEFDESSSSSIPVLVTSPARTGEDVEEKFDSLLSFIQKGGTAVYLEGPGTTENQGPGDTISSPGFPFHPRLERAQGLWTCIPHIVKEHPIFDGLPSHGMMRDIYQNVWANTTLIDLGGETLVGSIGFVWFSRDHKRGYLGPGDSWWGADLALVPYGRGRCLVSQLRIVQHLGKDPVADILLNNIIRFVSD